MSLTPIQRELVETLLGVKPRKKGLHFSTPDEKQDKKIGGALDDYERRESKVLEAVKQLESVPATGQIVVDLEQRVSLIRRSVLTTGRDVAPEVIEKAYEDLESIKKEAEAAAKLANANKEFYAKLENADRDLHALENHEHHGFIADRIHTVESTLQEARDAAKGGDFGTANTRLGTAVEASRTAKEAVDQYGRDLTAFNLKAATTETGLTSLDKHPKKAAGATELNEGATKLSSARIEAAAGHFPAASLLLGQADLTPAAAKLKADAAFKLDIDAAALDLDTVRNNDDPAVVKAMAHTVGEIEVILQTARGQVDAEIENADASLKEAVRRIGAAKGIRDKLVIDLKKVRDDATAADARLAALNAHPQKVHVKTEIDAATAKLVEVRAKADDGLVDLAEILYGDVDTNCTTAKDCADKYAAFLVSYAAATRICNGATRAYPKSATAKNALVKLAKAKTKANDQRKYTEAKADVDAAMLPVQAKQTGQYKTDSTAEYTADIDELARKAAGLVPAKKGKIDPKDGASSLDNLDPDPESVVAKRLEAINALKAKIEADAEAGRYDEMEGNKIVLSKMVTSAKKLVARRELYNTERENTLKAIKDLGTHKSLFGHMMSLNNLVVRADRLATAKDMRFEDACKELAEVRKTCEMLDKVGKAADTYLKERAEADTALEELEKVA